ncbi:ADP-ribosylation factor-like protein [Drosera capensis]
MGLLSIIRKIKKKEKEMRILMVGFDNSGKTTIVLKINGEDTSVISPTLGFNMKTISYYNSVDKSVGVCDEIEGFGANFRDTLNIWDVRGQKTIRSYGRNCFKQTDGLIWIWGFVHDLSLHNETLFQLRLEQAMKALLMGVSDR